MRDVISGNCIVEFINYYKISTPGVEDVKVNTIDTIPKLATPVKPLKVIEKKTQLIKQNPKPKNKIKKQVPAKRKK